MDQTWLVSGYTLGLVAVTAFVSHLVIPHSDDPTEPRGKPEMLIETINLHILERCNLRCAYCFGGFHAPSGALDAEGWCRIIDELPSTGVRRVTFSGGEPTLFHGLPRLLLRARQRGLQTGIVTNGAAITDEMLSALDLVGMTLDSARERVNAAIGRRAPKHIPYHEHVRQIAARVHAAGVLFKLNTVVCRLNADEDMVDAVTALAPFKWKPLQFTPIRGGNDVHSGGLCITRAQFDRFVNIHAAVANAGVWVAPEPSTVVNSTYVMVDPAGRVFLRSDAGYTASRPVLEVGMEQAVRDVGGYDRTAFLARGGAVDVGSLVVRRGAA